MGSNPASPTVIRTESSVLIFVYGVYFSCALPSRAWDIAAADDADPAPTTGALTKLLAPVAQRAKTVTLISSCDGLTTQHPAIQVFDLEVGHLPYTGGRGILPYLLVGLLLLGSAGAMRMTRI